MRHFGFSSWGWEPTFVESVKFLASRNIKTLEICSLRYPQLFPMLDEITFNNELKALLKTFDKITLHAPSNTPVDKEEIVAVIYEVDTPKEWQIVLHPDCVWDCNKWRHIQDRICVENMDERKPFGQTVAQLKTIFRKLPQAKFCFDIGHARQVDPSMQLAKDLVDAFGDRLAEVHMSVVSSDSGGHNHLTKESLFYFKHILPYVKDDIVVIIETPSDKDKIDDNLWYAQQSFLPHKGK